MKHKLLAAAVLCVALALAGFTYQTTATRSAWEYQIITVDSSLEDRTLKSLGAVGWELVTVWPDARSSGKTFYFRRPK